VLFGVVLLLLVDLIEIADVNEFPIFAHVVLFFGVLLLAVIDAGLLVLGVVLFG